MYYKSLLLMGFCVVAQLLSAQNNTKSTSEPVRIIDSLKQVLLTAKEDTNKVKALNALSKQLWQTSEYDQARAYANQALVLSDTIVIGKEQGWIKGQASSHESIGIICWNQGDYPEALKNHLVSLKLYEQLGNKKGIGNAHNNIGIVFLRQGKYEDALKNYFICLKIREETKDSAGIASSYMNIGGIYQEQGNYPDALKFDYSSLKIREKIKDRRGVASCYGNIGKIYKDLGNYSEALKYQLAALSIHRELEDKQGIAASYTRLGIIYELQGDTLKALKNHLDALSIRKEIGDKMGIATSYLNIGDIYSEQGQYDAALSNCLSALQIFEEIGYQNGIAVSYVTVGEIFTKLKKFTEGFQYLNKGLLLLKGMGNKAEISETYGILASACEGLKDYKKAYEYLQLYSNSKDTILNDENNKHIAEMQAQYESEKKDAQILVLNKDNELQTQQASQQRIIRNILIAGFALLLLIAFLFINRLRLKQRLKLQGIRNNIASDLHDDVGSVLSSIAIFSELANEEVKDKSPKAVALLQTINENARTTIDAMSDTVWAINPKNDRFENIMVRMRSFAAGILEAKNIDLSFPPSPALSDLKLSMEKRKNLYLIFKEAVNNVAKYSLSKNCSIQLGLEGKKLSMEITDDGIGFNMNDHHAGNGQLNMKKRSEELNGALDIQSEEGKGTRIHLSFTT